MRLFNRKKDSVLTDKIFKLEQELYEVRRLVFPKEGYGWITIGKPEKNKFDEINDKLNIIAKHLGLEFSKIKNEYELVPPKEEKKK
jgi:hypothetical protein